MRSKTGFEDEACRDGYRFYLDKKAKRNKTGEWIESDLKCLASEWHKIAPLECRLTPGAGPIRIEMRRVSK